MGIMQGRLLPAQEGRIQSFPAGRWAEEFPRAAAAGLDSIEWIYDDDAPGVNPLETSAGIDAVRQAAAETGVAVGSVCADRFMVRRLIDQRGEVEGSALDELRGLIVNSARLGAAHIVLPFVDASALPTSPERAGLERLLAAVLPNAERAAVELHLETDWAPEIWRSLSAAFGIRCCGSTMTLATAPRSAMTPPRSCRCSAPTWAAFTSKTEREEARRFLLSPARRISRPVSMGFDRPAMSERLSCRSPAIRSSTKSSGLAETADSWKGFCTAASASRPVASRVVRACLVSTPREAH